MIPQLLGRTCSKGRVALGEEVNSGIVSGDEKTCVTEGSTVKGD